LINHLSKFQSFRRHTRILLITVVFGAIVLGLSGCSGDDNFETPIPTGFVTELTPVATVTELILPPSPARSTPTPVNSHTATPSPTATIFIVTLPTPTSTVVAVVSTQQPTATTTAPTNTIAPIPTDTPTVVPVVPTAVPSPVPTVTPTPTVPSGPTPTPTPSPTPTATQAPTIPAGPPSPTPVPTSTPDPYFSVQKAGVHSDKYGVIVDLGDPAVIASTLDTLNSAWYLRFASSIADIQPGYSRPLYIEVTPGGSVRSTAELQVLADAVPGAIWYISGEPNRQFGVDDIIGDLRYYYTEIKLIDPTARITSPSVLNWDFTCIGCGGYTSGKAWMEEFVSRYQDLYGSLPPWDIWAIDLYPLDWHNLPNTGFLPEVIQQYAPNLPPNDKSIPVTQLQAYRDYIDSLPGKSGQPILVTEIGIHWGWTGISFTPECPVGKPTGEYQPLTIRDYFDSVFTWFEDHAISHNIERWFTYTAYSDVANCRYDGYSGMSLMDDATINAGLSDLGRWYVSRSRP
jgi:hypothetical protein